MKIITAILFAFIPVLAICQSNENVVKLQRFQNNQNKESNVEKSYRAIEKNNFAAYMSIDMGNIEKGAIAILFSGGYEKNFGNPRRNGYFFSGELRVKVGRLIDLMGRTELLTKQLVYDGMLTGGSIAIRAYTEVLESLFIYLEGEYGAMYEYINVEYKINNAEINKSDSFVVPQTGLKVGMRSGRLSLYLGYLYFNHTRAVN
jgi:hypothetical protein